MNNYKFDLREYMMLYPFLTEKECNKTIKKIKKLDWTKHSYRDGNTEKTNQYDNDLYITYSGDQKSEFFSLQNQKIKLFLETYCLTIFGSIFIHNNTLIRYNRYRKGEEMRKHYDHISTIFDGNIKGIPILTVLGALNDDYEGGDLIFFNDTKINIPVGHIIIFPSIFLYPHAVTPVTKGKRYSFVSWAW